MDEIRVLVEIASEEFYSTDTCGIEYSEDEVVEF